MVANDRHEQIRELRRAGHSVGDVSERLSVSRQTVWRACKGIEPVPTTTTPTPTPVPDSNGHVDLETARGVGLGVLVDRARGGSVSAAGLLFKQASDQLRADRCKDHVALVDVVKALQAQYGLWRMHLQGAFVRRMLLEFDVDPARIEGLVDDAVDVITSELNTRFAEGEHG